MSEEEIEAIDETMRLQQFEKGTILLKEGQVSSDTYFVLEGIVRQYYLIDGLEKTSDFFSDEQWVISLQHINLNNPSPYYLECCTDCALLIGNSQKGEGLYKKFPNLETVSRKLMESVFTGQQEKIEAFTINTPTMRYQNLLQSRPDLFQRIPQYQIASYIGVTPESLSRIRKRIARQN
ncbi:Crp/Fnr family transcriptional regulator [Aridibaculum aurantiacum]|uniref:Crp/Fnr family transcriptional regulator n=1 Tax=Aridibaculum aurantiacum TaxID=2810307 RepID=UPI001A9769D6|nr:Crp/Fnr family transcriptional regulator [Aridibaculum aurantiacum]